MAKPMMLLGKTIQTLAFPKKHLEEYYQSSFHLVFAKGCNFFHDFIVCQTNSILQKQDPCLTYSSTFSCIYS
jgi:hypothetical protein